MVDSFFHSYNICIYIYSHFPIPLKLEMKLRALQAHTHMPMRAKKEKKKICTDRRIIVELRSPPETELHCANIDSPAM